MYSIAERGKAGNDFYNAFGISIRHFYDNVVTAYFQRIKIDPFKFDDYLHQKHGNYEKQGKSMNDIVIENYGENALEILKELV